MGNTQYALKINSPTNNQGFPYILTIGLPFRKSFIPKGKVLEILDHQQNSYIAHLRPTLYWPDKSIKWGILDIFVSKPAYEPIPLFFHSIEKEKSDFKSSSICVKNDGNKVKIDTGCSEFVINKNQEYLFENIKLGFKFVTVNGKNFYFNDLKNKKIQLVNRGRLRVDLLIKGQLYLLKKPINLRFILSFFYLSSVVKIDVEIHNPNASIHPGGKWDLGDIGSLYFKDLSMFYKSDTHIQELRCFLNNEKRDTFYTNDFDKFIIHQNSSGAERWNSPNHIDKDGNLTVKFRGFELKKFNNNHETKKITGLISNPIIITKQDKYISFSIKNFWQNFPKLIEVTKNYVRLSLFPKEAQSYFELQGGEKKTHTIYIDLDSDQNGDRLTNFLYPPQIEINPIWIKDSKAFPYFIPEEEDKNIEYKNYIKNIITGPNSFFEKNKKIDEFGWRHFGDIYADHEAVNHKEDTPFISHYNNQYDFLYGSIIHFLRSGDKRWFDLIEPLAQHLIDIDIYHTDGDKAAYNHGMFWHTDHYVEAKTATHRTYSKLNQTPGGGPSNEHNYTTGLLHYYLLTGNIQAKEAVLELANWVMDMDDGSKTIFSLFDQGPTGLASQTADPMYHKPGRGAGNSINTLIDAYILTNNRNYLFKAEEIIRRTIHPKDDIDILKLDEPEYRWSYLVYLQILDKYISLKSELNEIDWMYFYARDSLIHYGKWILNNEVPYKDVLHKVDIPTETWPAQDIRKAYVLNCVSKYVSSTEKRLFLEKARFFFNRCLQDLLSFKTAYLTRPMVILCVYGFQQAYFDNIDSNYVQSPFEHNYDFGEPEVFLPQKYRWKYTLKRNIKTFSKEIKRIIIERLWKARKKLHL